VRHAPPAERSIEQGDKEETVDMMEPIEANYVPDGDDWTVTVIGRGKTLTASAPGLIAARDNADQLAEELAPDDEHRTVVHLLNGDAVEFTSVYLTARLAKREQPEKPTEQADAAAQEAKSEKKPGKKSPSPRARRPAPEPLSNGEEPTVEQPAVVESTDEVAPPTARG
jgi:hypothetical protein